MKDKFVYFLNAVHYCIYLEEVTTNKKIEKAVNHFLLVMATFLFPRQMRIRLQEQRYRNNIKRTEYLYGNEYGLSIGMAHHLFGAFYSCLPAFISWICLGVADRQVESLPAWLVLIVLTIPISIGYIPMHMAVFHNDRYIVYFKKYEKEDEGWHKKWKRITLAFCVFSIAMMVLGFFCMAVITSF